MQPADIRDQNLQELDHDQLLEAANTLQKSLEESQSEKVKLESDLKHIKDVSQRVPSFPSSTSSTEPLPFWIRAEVDCPTETTWSWFRMRNKYRTVIVYDRSSSTLQARTRQSLKDERAGIYSKIPSRTAGTFYVFVECAITAGTSTGIQQKFWVSKKEPTPQGYVPYCTIHLGRLSLITRVRIWTGQIKWLYILQHSDSHKQWEG